MKPATGAPALALIVSALTFGAAPAHASVIPFTFNGNGVAGSGFITTVLNVAPPDPDPTCGMPGHNPCRTDPPGALRVTGISGTFTDPSNNLFGAAITGLVPTNPAPGRSPIFDSLIPSSMSWFDYDVDGDGNPVGMSYSNLYYPAGTPVVCGDFEFAGGLLDVYGLAFNVEGGYTAVLWGDGDLHGPGTTTYGLKMVLGSTVVRESFDGISMSTVPEPGTFALLGLGLGVLGLVTIRRRPATT